jgi:hypothetical protein
MRVNGKHITGMLFQVAYSFEILRNAYKSGWKSVALCERPLTTFVESAEFCKPRG